jgi:hypothetical protein
MGKAIIVALKVLLLEDGGLRMDSALGDSLLIFGLLAIVLAPMALALAESEPGGTGWKLITFLCCTFAAWFFVFGADLHRALVAWILGWACALAMRMSRHRRRA